MRWVELVCANFKILTRKCREEFVLGYFDNFLSSVLTEKTTPFFKSCQSSLLCVTESQTMQIFAQDVLQRREYLSRRLPSYSIIE